MLFGTMCWFFTRTNLVALLIMTISTSICILYRFEEDPILIAMTLSYVIRLSDMLKGLLYAMSTIE
jgi:hypothetical protein